MDSKETKVFDSRRKLENKLPLDALVTIGDALHECQASFILVLDETIKADEFRTITFAQHGERNDIIQMFERCFDKNPEFVEMVLEAVVRSKLNKMMNN